MSVIVDTNIILDIFNEDDDWFEWSNSQLEILKSSQAILLIDPIIYSEVSVWFDNIESVESALAEFEFKWEEIPKEGLFFASKAFLAYKRRSGIKTRTLPDFFIGGHAQSRKYQILTRDRRRYSTYFPKVKLISPEQ